MPDTRPQHTPRRRVIVLDATHCRDRSALIHNGSAGTDLFGTAPCGCVPIYEPSAAPEPVGDDPAALRTALHAAAVDRRLAGDDRPSRLLIELENPQGRVVGTGTGGMARFCNCDGGTDRSACATFRRLVATECFCTCHGIAIRWVWEPLLRAGDEPARADGVGDSDGAVSPPDRDTPDPIWDLIGARPVTFGLQPRTRLLVAELLADGQDWPDIAAAVGWDTDTLRAHYARPAAGAGASVAPESPDIVLGTSEDFPYLAGDD